ncbi:MAG: hypothetical protein AB1Z55_05130, partial [Acidimicrobiia bacterium]
GRPFDPRLPSNRNALLVAVAAGAVGVVLGLVESGDWAQDWIEILLRGVVLGAASLLAWATARELDHDEPGGALVAAVLAPLAVASWGRPAFLAGVALLMAARLALRSTGRVPTLVDQIVLLGLGGLAALPVAGWVAAMTLSVALAREGGRSSDRAPAGRITGFGLALVATIAHYAFGDAFTIPDGGQPALAVVVGVIALGSVFLIPRRPPAVPCDRTETPPSGSDQFAARILAGTGASAATLVSVSPEVAAPTVAALVGVAVFGRVRGRSAQD